MFLNDCCEICLLVPSQPELFAGEAISATQIRLTWRQRETEAQITYYELYYNDSKSEREQHRSIPIAETYILEDLKPNTVYNIRLAARSRAGQGASTPIIAVRTEQAGTYMLWCCGLVFATPVTHKNH